MNKRNLQKELDTIIEENRARGVIPRLLLHACCAPCSSYCLEYLSKYFEITLFYYNPNIYPENEYSKRAAEAERLAASLPAENKINVKVCEFVPEEYNEAVRGFESCREGGERCERCFKLRLGKTAAYAKENGFDFFTTTLSISPLKNAALLCSIGEQEGEKAGVKYLPADFKKRGGYLRSVELSREYGLYRQDYCGCTYSYAESVQRRREKENRDGGIGRNG